MKKSFLRIRTVVFSGLLLAGSATVAHAQATRTWVSGVGNDANPCSRTAPCKTFAGAISKTAAGGLIDVLDPGGFGTITITKSITIDGNGFKAGLLASGGINAVNVPTAGIVVTLRNLSLEGNALAPSPLGLNGINVTGGAEVHVENCVIQSFSNNAIKFAPSTPGTLFVRNTTIHNNAAGGIVISNGRATIDGLHAENNANAVAVVGAALVSVSNSYAAGGSNGFAAIVNPGAVLNIDSSEVTNNTNGIVVNSGATVRLSNTMIVSNSINGLQNDGISNIVSLQGNSLVGNPMAGAFTNTVVKQ